MIRPFAASLLAASLLLSACTSMAPSRPAAWSAPEVLVAPSSFTGVHGLAVDTKGRLLAGSVVGSTLWEVDRKTGAVKGSLHLYGKAEARIGGEAEIIIRAERQVFTTVDRDPGTLRGLEQAPRAAQAARFAFRQFGGELGVQ